MGARNRKRRAVARQVAGIRESAAAQYGPHMARVAADGKVDIVLNPPRPHVSERPTPEHAVERMSRGHQYVKGDRAPIVRQTRQQKARNARARRELRDYRISYGVDVTEYGVRRVVGERTGRIVAQEAVTRTVRVRSGVRVRPGERTERAEDQVAYNAEIVSGREFTRAKDWHAVRVSRVSD